MRDHDMTVVFTFPVVDGKVKVGDHMVIDHKRFEAMLLSDELKRMLVQGILDYLEGDSNESITEDS